MKHILKVSEITNYYYEIEADSQSALNAKIRKAYTEHEDAPYWYMKLITRHLNCLVIFQSTTQQVKNVL